MRVYQSPPNYYLDDHGQWTGLVFELANAVIKEAGCTAEYVDIPWNRALKMLELGKIDMMTSLSVTEKRRKFIHFFGVQHEEKISPIVKKATNFKTTNLDDFKNLPGSIGHIRGAFYGKNFDYKKSNELWFNNKVVAYNSTDELINGLRKNRLSMFLYDRDNAAYMLSQYTDGENFKLHPYTVFKNTVYFGLSKNISDKSLLEKLRQSYFRVRESGELSAINEKYRSQLFNRK
jgi:polar amino acid transport system substrate-binding protein